MGRACFSAASIWPGAGITAKVPLDSGWLTGRFNSTSRFEGIRARWKPNDITRRADLVPRLDWLIEDGSDLAHKAIGYLLSCKEVSCVIPGIRTRQQLAGNLEAALQVLAPSDRQRLEKFWDEFTDGGRNLLPW